MAMMIARPITAEGYCETSLRVRPRLRALFLNHSAMPALSELNLSETE